jgi:hypothetical protein
MPTQGRLLIRTTSQPQKGHSFMASCLLASRHSGYPDNHFVPI